jgi:5-oxopent-3-ene-1,2,5-tricarboxylate decarboxylase/2-hydroxyhepta-2,4-diene-1,7-dioate isomerase
MTSAGNIPVDIAPFRLSGTVYGVLLNHSSAIEELGTRAHQPPYSAPPVAPVLYLKPRNTQSVSGRPIVIPAGVEALEIGACLGLVIGRTACNVSVTQALEYVSGYLIVNDVSVPHDVFYRPSIRLKARDGFCPMGPRVVARERITNPDSLVLRTFVDGTLVQEANTAFMVRPTARLLADVTEFMTLAAGDVLAMGAARPSPRVRAGQSVEIRVDGLGSLSNPVVEEES